MTSKIIPREYYKTFILAGKAGFIAHCSLTNNKLHFFVRKRKSSKDMYNIYIWDNSWIHVACYFDTTKILHVYTSSKKYRNAINAVFEFEFAPDWLALEHTDRCPRCGRKITNSHYGFGEECWKKTFNQLSMEVRDESN